MDAQEFRSLQEAYEAVYENQQLDEASSRDEFTRAAIARNSGRKGGITFEPGPNWDPSANRGKGAHLSPKQKEKQRRKALRQEEVDFFDVILEHLVAEGFADTNEAALAIMANMSEEWRDDIVEELTGERRERAQEKIRELQPKGRRRKSTDAAVSAIDRVVRSKEGGKDPSKFPTKRGGEGEKGKMKSYRLGGSHDRGSGNKAARRAGTYIDHETDY